MKKYAKPAIDVIRMGAQSLMAASGEKVMEKGAGPASTEYEVLTRRHTGSIWEEQ
ncbi:MAG: hypothetical protein IJ692_06490 [Alloprevotella sp.]|nr:hypothetical protein [Alloprevotella sp.]MBR1653020.1 hypothetical protein [Alloprevotella sp.]